MSAYVAQCVSEAEAIVGLLRERDAFLHQAARAIRIAQQPLGNRQVSTARDAGILRCLVDVRAVPGRHIQGDALLEIIAGIAGITHAQRSEARRIVGDNLQLCLLLLFGNAAQLQCDVVALIEGSPYDIRTPQSEQSRDQIRGITQFLGQGLGPRIGRPPHRPIHGLSRRCSHARVKAAGRVPAAPAPRCPASCPASRCPW